jgi:nicotinate-nucleotide adenylyltransferase
MRILCFGGSFNPIHHGHLICARAAAEAAGFEQVLLIPSARPPHKLGHLDLALALDRLTMCQAAVDGTPFFAVSDIELRRSEPSYTLTTARELKTTGVISQAKVAWLIGEDTVPQLPTWHRPAELMAEVDLVVMRRPGSLTQWEALPEPFRGLQRNLVDAPQLEISATEIRRRVAAGKSIRYLVPPAVEDVIRERNLYRQS